jgi:transcriptional regulator with XRE-family HTH domain
MIVEGGKLRRLRATLALSRAELSRFLGVSEATLARWESREHTSEPRGLQAFLLEMIAEACETKDEREVARLVRRSGLDYRRSLSSLLAAADRQPSTAP